MTHESSTDLPVYVPLGMNVLLALALTGYVALAEVDADGGNARLLLVAALWGVCLLTSGVGFLGHRMLRRYGAVPAMVPPVLSFIVFGRLVVGALQAMAAR